MKNKKQKIKVGTGTRIFYGRTIRIDIRIDDLPEEYTYQYDDGIRYIRLNVNELQVPKHNKTHSVTVDTWKPDEHNQGKKTNSPSDDEMPF